MTPVEKAMADVGASLWALSGDYMGAEMFWHQPEEEGLRIESYDLGIKWLVASGELPEWGPMVWGEPLL